MRYAYAVKRSNTAIVTDAAGSAADVANAVSVVENAADNIVAVGNKHNSKVAARYWIQSKEAGLRS